MKADPERAAEILAAAQKHGVLKAAEVLGITHQGVYASIKRWHPLVTLPKSARPKKHQEPTAEAKFRRKEQVRQTGRRRYAKAKASGHCLKCLSVPAEKGLKTCNLCREKMKAYSKSHVRKKA